MAERNSLIAEVRQDGAPIATDNLIAARIGQLRQLQAELQSRPVTGSLPRVKKLVYKVIHSTFSRQFRLNTATIDLIETVYRQLENPQPSQDRSSRELHAPTQPSRPFEIENEITFSQGEVVASCGQTQDQTQVNNIRPLTGFNFVYTAPAEMRMPERVLLYSLVFALQPKNCLEIGTFRGGSSAIICGALADTGHGQLACVDPLPKVDPELWSKISGRCRLFEGPSPDILPEVCRQVGTAFDFVLIDANHTYEYVRRDIVGSLPVLTDHAYLLFHDGNYPDVQRALDDALTDHRELTDCGLLSVEPTVLQQNNRAVHYAGLRLLKFQRSRTKK